MPVWRLSLRWLCYLRSLVQRATLDPVALSASDYAAFMQRPSVTAYARHGIPFVDSEKLLLLGERDQSGFCMRPTVSLPVELASESLNVGSIDLAYDADNCDQVIEVGTFPSEAWDALVAQRRIDGLAANTTFSATGIVPPAPTAGGGQTIQFISDVTDTQPTPLAAAAAEQWGVYTEYNDGNNPLFRSTNYSIPVNWIDSNLSFSRDYCQVGGTLAGSHELYANSSTGWYINPTYDNRITLGGSYCEYSCTSTSCTVTDWQFRTDAYIQFRNDGVEGLLHATSTNGLGGFPTCIATVLVTYRPNGLKIGKGQSKPTSTLYSTITGPSTFCVDWQRRFTQLYFGLASSKRRVGLSPNP